MNTDTHLSQQQEKYHSNDDVINCECGKCDEKVNKNSLENYIDTTDQYFCDAHLKNHTGECITCGKKWPIRFLGDDSECVKCLIALIK